MGGRKRKMVGGFGGDRVILTPAAPGPPPLGLDSTGDPRMNSTWTALGTPAVSVPMAWAGAMPVGLQMTARPGDYAMLLDFAVAASRYIANFHISAIMEI